MSRPTGTWGSHPIRMPDNTTTAPLPIRRRTKCGSYFAMIDRRRQTVKRNPDGTFTLDHKPLASMQDA